MFLMVVKAKSGKRTYEYVHLCESVWKNGRSSRRTIASLGRKDRLEPHLERLYELCRGQQPAASADPVPLASFRYGPFLALRTLWHELGLPALLGPLSDRVLVLVANRLTAPASEHGLADWLRTHFACDSQGRRFAPAYRSDAERQASKTPRVRVKAFQLQRWYRTLDALLPLKNRLEEHLFDRFQHLFAPQCDLVFYDLTSTYFEGLGPGELAQRGYSRDRRPDAPQLLIGVAMVDGLPVSHTVFEGNRQDSTTVGEVIADLRRRFGLGRFVFVGDRGMKSEGSVAALEGEGLGYLLAVQGRRSPRMEEALERMREAAWQACEGADGEALRNGSRVQEVTRKGERVRRFVVHSPEREAHERKLREAQQERVRQKLERLQARVAAGEFARKAERERPARAKRAAKGAEDAAGGGDGCGGADRGRGGADPGAGQRAALLRLAVGRGGAAGVLGERALRGGKAARGALAAGDGGDGAERGGGGAGLPGPVAGGSGVPVNEGRAGVAAGVAPGRGAGAGARAGSGAGAGVRSDPAAEAGAGRPEPAELAGGVGGAGGGQPGGVRTAGWGAQGGGVRERRGGRRGPPGAAGAGSEAGGPAAAGGCRTDCALRGLGVSDKVCKQQICH